MLMNGWQRLWILVAGLWALLVGGFAFSLLPTTVYLPDHPQRSVVVLSRMTASNWDGGDCKAGLEVSLSDGRRLTGWSDWFDINQPKADVETVDIKMVLERMVAAKETEDNIR